ncbi:hypothetical protein DL770_000536 [Monosporascus sp. CRB-9-2]|nr:hypothetical protein DL770_000536 [Monosporascus sp. CRB-9-2]
MYHHGPFNDNASVYSDDSSVSSGSSGSSGYTWTIGSGSSISSTWSSSDSVSFVYRLDDPWGWGYDGIAGAVTRHVDRCADPKVRFAAHLLSGPFAQYSRKKKKKHGYGSSSRSNRSHGQQPRSPAAALPFRQPLHADSRMGCMGGPLPPPPPVGPPPQARFESGFIDLNAPRGPPPPSRPVDPFWANQQPGHCHGAPPPPLQVFD